MASELPIALNILRATRPVALEHFRSPLAVDNKKGDTGFDPVTIADRNVETFIRDQLSQHWPADAVVGEEQGGDQLTAARTWIIDPIDGTRAFISGQLGWGVLLGLLNHGVPKLGFMHQPYTEEIFYGSVGHGAFMTRHDETKPLHTSAVTELSDAILYSTHPDLFAGSNSLTAYQAVAQQCKLMRYGGDCYNYCMLAAGCIDLIIEDDLQPYDILPLVPIVEAAGGVVTNLEGDTPLHGGMVIAAATPALHAQALAVLKAKLAA